jgi:hypothetical protein
VTLTRGSAVMMALRTVPRLGRLPEWKAHHEALELEFAQLVRGPNVIDQGVLPHDPGANRGGPSVNVDTNIWGRGPRKCRPPTGMY